MVICIMHRIFPRWDANTLISNSLLILLLSTYIVIVYVVIAIAGSIPFGGLHDPFPYVLSRVSRWLDLLGFVLVGVTVFPVSRWLSTRIHDLVYSQDDIPYVLTALVTKHLQNMTSPQLTLPTLVEAIAHTLGLPYAAIETTLVDPILHYSSGKLPPRGEVTHYTINYLDNPIGELIVSTLRAGRPIPPSYGMLLKDIAQMLGIALRVALLTSELQTSREHLVITREEERRRIRNDLHDGLAPTLSSIQLQLGAVRNLIQRDPVQTEVLINDMLADIRNATAEIRQLVYDLRPPMLDELGLIGAIRNSRAVKFR